MKIFNTFATATLMAAVLGAKFGILPDDDITLPKKNEKEVKDREESLSKNLQMFDNMLSMVNSRLQNLSDLLDEAQLLNSRSYGHKMLIKPLEIMVGDGEAAMYVFGDLVGMQNNVDGLWSDTESES